jgi:hypothetical protein
MNNRIRWYRHVLRMDKDKIPEMIFNMKIKGKFPKETPRSRREQQVRNLMQKERRTCRKQRRRRQRTVGYTEKDKQARFLMTKSGI